MIACVVIPTFGASILRQQHDIDPVIPVIAAQYHGARGQVAGADTLALAAGVRPHMPLPRARALCPEADIRLMQPGHLRQVSEGLCDSLSAFSQYLERLRGSSQSAVFLLDLGRLKAEVGLQIGADIVIAIAQAGLTCKVGLASNPFTARAAALTAQDSTQLISLAETTAFLSRQSVSLLPLSKETRRRLHLFGLRTLGQIAAIPRGALALQFGTEGSRIHRLACGEDGRRIARWAPREIIHASRSFELALEDGLIAQSVLDALASELMEPLIARQHTCAEVVLTMRLDDGSEQEASQRPRAPISEQSELSRALRRLFATLKFRAGIVRVDIQIGQLAPARPRQLPLFEMDALENSRTLLAALSARYGETLFYSIAAHVPASPLQELRFYYAPVEAA